MDAAVETFGRIDVIVNNAGLMPSSPLERLKIDDWDRMIDVNIKGVLYGIAAALPHMQKQKSGHIVNVSSVAGHKVRAGTAVYAATKHAVRVLTEGLRQEVERFDIRTTIVSPGAVATELPDSITESDVQAGGEGVLLRDRDPGRRVRPRGRLRAEPAGRRRHQRDPVPADPSGILSLSARRFVRFVWERSPRGLSGLTPQAPALANTHRLRNSGVERIARHADKAAAPRGPLRAA